MWSAGDMTTYDRLLTLGPIRLKGPRVHSDGPLSPSSMSNRFTVPSGIADASLFNRYSLKDCIQVKCRSHQGFGVIVLRRRVYLLCRSLLNNPAILHNDDVAA